jgi:hypothetical protein
MKFKEGDLAMKDDLLVFIQEIKDGKYFYLVLDNKKLPKYNGRVESFEIDNFDRYMEVV